MKEKTNSKNIREMAKPSDDNDIIDLTESAQDNDKFQSQEKDSFKENQYQDIIELAEEAKPLKDDEIIIDLTEEISIPSEKKSASSINFPKDTPVSDRMLEAAIERAIRKILLEKFELIFMEAVRKVTNEDIKKLKAHILQEFKNKV